MQSLNRADVLLLYIGFTDDPAAGRAGKGVQQESLSGRFHARGTGYEDQPNGSAGSGERMNAFIGL